MKAAFRIVGAAMLAASVAVAAGAETSGSATIWEGFQDPPIIARPAAFWNWLNGNTDPDRIRYDLAQMKEKGMGGGEIWDVAAIKNGDQVPAGPEFLSPESVARIKLALAEGKKLGLRMGMITSSGWNAGGTWVTPDWASKCLVVSTTVTTGPVHFHEKLKFPEVGKEVSLTAEGLPQFYKDVAVLAVPAGTDKVVADPVGIVNLTDKMQPDGTLDWGAPAGEWHILRFVCTNTGQYLIVPSPKSRGLMIDFLDPEATKRHLQVIMDRLGITPVNAAESGLNYLEVDSMELEKGIPWTDAMLQRFQDYRGYEATPWLPVLAGYTLKDKATSDRFMYDFKNAVGDLLIHSHYETGSAFLKEYGMDFVGEAGGPGPPIWDTCPVDALKALGNVTVPRGEFWIQHRNMFLIKEVASASHTYGKPLVDAESFTTWRRWMDAPFALKAAADRAFAEGLNHITIHGFAHSPDAAGLPGFTYHAGIDINPNTTWWPYARPFMDYLARCSYLLQQGRPVADVLWYYGDQAPNFFPLFHNVPQKPRLPGLGRGRDYDVVNSDVILNRLAVKDGRWVLPEGTSYRVLAIAPDAAMTLPVLQKLAELVKQGGVLTGEKPTGAPGLHNADEQTSAVKALADSMWPKESRIGPSAFDKGLVFGPTDLDMVLGKGKIALDFEPGEALEDSLDYVHRATDDMDIYFVRNETTRPLVASSVFRTTRPEAALWHPDSGAREAVTTEIVETDRYEDRTSVTFDLEANGSVFVVFGDKGTVANGAAPATSRSVQTAAVNVRGPWQVTFPEGRGAPTSVTMERLDRLDLAKQKAIRYFAGTAVYAASFDWQGKPGQKLTLDLGELYDVADVKLNGQELGVRWKPPYTYDVTGAVRPGANALEIAVTTQWHNRLVGDANTTASKRVTSSNHPLPKKDTPLVPAGLMGPVRVSGE